MSVLSKLSQEEKDMISFYIETFGEALEPSYDGFYEMGSSYDNIASIDYRLREWDKAKSQYLEKIFGNKLIVETPITFTAPIKEIDFTPLYATKLHKKLCEISAQGIPNGVYPHDSPQENFIYEYLADGTWCNEIDANSPYYRFHRCYHMLNSFRQEDYLFDNIYHGETYILKQYDKKIKIPSGIKVSRLVAKLVNFFNLPEEDYEEWRILHSQITNTKFFTGNLCLSIHPMDYITMSDATFSSCMNWRYGGCYRRGTVEMMNSNCVVVAYLKSKHETLDFGKYSWNLKKWRTLLILTSDLICSIKAYPYQHNELTIKALDILTEMAESAHLNTYEKTYNNFSDTSYIFDKNDIDSHYINFDACGAMYCDFGTTLHFIKLSTNYNKNENLNIDYCGNSVCMFCGKLTSSFDDYYDESRVYCNDCCIYYEEINICSCCGTNIYNEDDVVWCDDEPYCSDCSYRYLRSCNICGQTVAEDNAYPLILSYKGINLQGHHDGMALRKLNNDYRDETESSWICPICYNQIREYNELAENNSEFLYKHSRIRSWVNSALYTDPTSLICKDNESYVILNMDKCGNSIFKPYFFNTTQIFTLEDFAFWLYNWQSCIEKEENNNIKFYTKDEIYDMIKPDGTEDLNGITYLSKNNCLVKYLKENGLKQ